MFKAIGRAISRPIRGIGRVVRGIAGDGEALRKGVGDIGHGVKAAAPFIPGIGTAASVGMGALGGMAERLGKDDANLGTVMGAGLTGGAKTGLANIGKGLMGKGAGAAGQAGGAGPGGFPGIDPSSYAGGGGGGLSLLSKNIGGGGAGALPGIGNAMATAGATPSRGVGGMVDKVKDTAGRLGGWAEKKPELAGQVAGTAAEAYGAHQMGKAADREFELGEEKYRTRQQEREDAIRRIMERRKGAGRR